MTPNVVRIFIIAVSTILMAFSAISAIAADLPHARVYKVPDNRSDQKNHYSAMVIVTERRWQKKTTYGLMFSPKKGKFKNQAFSCEDAIVDRVAGSLSCVRYGEIKHNKTLYLVEESFAIGAIGGEYCTALRAKFNSKSSSPIMEPVQCDRSKKCMCYQVAHACWDSASKDYTAQCPEFDDESKRASDDFEKLTPPGRGAGSGGSN